MKSTVQKMLELLTRRVIRKFRPDVIGITGSVGKTTTKEITTQLLSHRFRVRGSVGSYNNEFGLPLTVLGLPQPKAKIGWVGVIIRGWLLLLFGKKRQYPEMLVLEMGADRPGDIQYLTDVSPCCVGVVTAVSRTHLEFFKTVQKVIREKQVMVSHLDKTGLAVLNRDIAEVWNMRSKTDAEVVSFGRNPDADVIATDVMPYEDRQTGWPAGMRMKVQYQGSTVPIRIPGFLGEQIAYPALAAMAVGLHFGMNLVELSNAFSTITLPPGRSRVIPGIKDTCIIDDTYNASPLSVKEALSSLKHVVRSTEGRSYVVLGDMLELGNVTAEAHREVGLRVAEVNPSFFITVGEASKGAANAAIDAGMSTDHVVSFDASAEAGRFLQQKISTGDLLLVKGSRSMHMEKIVKELMAEPLRTEELLVH